MAQLFGPNVTKWTDMSDYVVHFTKDYASNNAYDNIIGILANRKIEARNRFGIGRDKAPDPSGQKAVCFSEVPLHLLKRLADKRSQYGIGFNKNFVIRNSGNPILYAYKDNLPNLAIQQLMEQALATPEAPIWNVTPFVDAPGKYSSGNYFFEWEREWRKVGDLHFAEPEVAFLIIPENLHDAARQFFKTAQEENLGPSYVHCPLIDANWDQARLAKEFGL